MPGNVGFQITGVKDTVAAFRQIDRELPKQMRKEFKEIADFVRDRIRSKIPGKAKGAIRSSATQTYAAITRPKGGPGDRDTRYGYYPWLDFGGGVVHARGVTANPHAPEGGWKVAPDFGGFRRPFIAEGRYIYPTIREYYPLIVDSALIAVGRVSTAAGYHTEGFPHGRA